MMAKKKKTKKGMNILKSLDKLGETKLKMVAKKSKQGVVVIKKPRELPADYHSPYFVKEYNNIKRGLFFS